MKKPVIHSTRVLEVQNGSGSKTYYNIVFEWTRYIFGFIPWRTQTTDNFRFGTFQSAKDYLKYAWRPSKVHSDEYSTTYMAYFKYQGHEVKYFGSSGIFDIPDIEKYLLEQVYHTKVCQDKDYSSTDKTQEFPRSQLAPEVNIKKSFSHLSLKKGNAYYCPVYGDLVYLSRSDESQELYFCMKTDFDERNPEAEIITFNFSGHLRLQGEDNRGKYSKELLIYPDKYSIWTT